MIIIKIIILYFIQIRHTDEFPSTGIPARTVECRHQRIPPLHACRNTVQEASCPSLVHSYSTPQFFSMGLPLFLWPPGVHRRVTLCENLGGIRSTCTIQLHLRIFAYWVTDCAGDILFCPNVMRIMHRQLYTYLF